MHEVFDFIIVGSGPGGSVTAELISKVGYRALVIEEAEALNTNYASHSLDEISEHYRHSGLSISFGKKPIALIEGIAIGGSSQINSGIYHRIPENVLHLWSKKVPALTDLDSIFDSIEKKLHINNNYQSNFTDMLIKGSKYLGWDYSMRPRWIESTRGNFHGLQKFTMLNTYLKDAISNNIQVIFGKKVLKIHMENDLWKVKTLNKSKKLEFFYCKKLILSAGAIQTPIILKNSGINNHIGKSIRLHPMVRFVYKFDNLVELPNEEVPPFQITKWLPESTLGCSASELRDITTWLNTPAFNYLKNDESAKYRVCYSLLSSNTVGKLIKVGRYQYRILYNLSNIDSKILLESIFNLNLLMKSSGASLRLTNLNINGFPIIKSSEPNWNNENILKKELKISNLSAIHIYGSCPMGLSDNVSACDQFGQVWNTKNLYINDSSILPDRIGVNPQGTIMALSIRNTMKMLEKC